MTARPGPTDTRAQTPAATTGDERVGTDDGERSTAERSPWIPPHLRGGLLHCLKVFLCVRIALSVLALVGVAVLPHFSGAATTLPSGATVPGPVGVPGWPAEEIAPGWHNLVTAWERFDGLWYLRIADGGYDSGDGSAAFFPLYPLTIRGMSFALGGHPLAAALLVSNLAFLAALMMLYVLSRSELGEEDARKAVVYAAVFPTAFFFISPYSESLFMLLVLVSVWGARRRRWAAAAAAGILAALTRNLGLLLVGVLAVEAIHQALERRPRRLQPRAVLASIAPVAGTLAYLAYWRARSGDWLAPLHQQTGWQRQLENPLFTLMDATREAFRWIAVYPGGYHLLDWLVVVPVVVAAVYAAWRFRPAYGLYVVGSLLVPLSYVFAGRPLMSVPRFALPLFPVYWAFARWNRTQLRHQLFVACSAAGLGLLTLLFVNWYYVF